MTERAQALEAIRERLKNFETVKHAMDRIGNTPLATTSYVEDVTTLLDLLAVQPPPPVGSPTTCPTCRSNTRAYSFAVADVIDGRIAGMTSCRDEWHNRMPSLSTPVEPAGASEPPPVNMALREANDCIVAIRARLWEVLDGRDLGGDRSLLAMVNRVIDQRDEARENRRGEFDLRMAAERRVVGASEPPSEPPSAGNQTYTVQMSDAEAAHAPCVWRELYGGSVLLRAECCDMWQRPEVMLGWKGCPYCLKPLTVER